MTSPLRVAPADVLVVSWVRHHGRSAGLAAALEAEAVFLPGSRRLPAPLRYVACSARTGVLLARRRPTAVVAMLPPFPLLVLLAVWARLTGGRVVGDLHSGVFNDERWTWATSSTLRLLRRHHALVTNPGLADRCSAARVPVTVLHDLLEPLPPRPAPPGGTPTVLVPAGWFADEPVEQVLGAAALRPDLRWLLTGRAPAAVREQAPAAVELTGFVSDEEFLELLGQASAVVALTTREHTMQRAAYEALCAGRPLVTSDTDTLRAFFEGTAQYAEPEAASIAAAVGRAVGSDPAPLVALLERRRAEQQEALDVLRGLVRGGA